MHVCNLHLTSSHNGHSLYLSMNKGYTTSILQLTCKKENIHQSVFYTGNRNHNHNLSLSYIECGNHRFNSNIPCVSSLRNRTPSPPHASVPPLSFLSDVVRNPTRKSGRPFLHNPFLLELARNTRFTSIQPLYSSLVGINCKIIVNRFSECVRTNACEEFGLVTH